MYIHFAEMRKVSSRAFYRYAYDVPCPCDPRVHALLDTFMAHRIQFVDVLMTYLTHIFIISHR
jgi:hypothetical protein